MVGHHDGAADVVGHDEGDLVAEQVDVESDAGKVRGGERRDRRLLER
jgi:hypothetical protein